MYFSNLEAITKGQVLQQRQDRPITTLVMDSRKAVVGEGSLFFALKGVRHDGHRFLYDLYKLGIRQFVVEASVDIAQLPDANLIKVDSSIFALQQLAIFHRNQFALPVVAITGSNGKTIIKEWLYQVLSPDFRVIKNPGSYNSQVGVPLSVWGIHSSHDIGIFEAGVSTTNEMENLRSIILPTFGIFTNLGTAHSEGFHSQQEKAGEKAKLFASCECTIFCKDHELVDQALGHLGIKTLSWGFNQAANILIQLMEETRFQVTYNEESFSLVLPFAAPAFQENAFHVVSFMLLRGYHPAIIQDRLNALHAVPMRLELKQGVHRSILIDDSYNNDLAGLQISLDFLRNQQKQKKVLILSDILQSGLSKEELLNKIESMVAANGVTDLIGIGPVLYASQNIFPQGTFHQTTEAFLESLSPEAFADAIVLIKGARPFQFERIVRRLERKVHGTVMEVNLTAMVHNLNHFKSRLLPKTKLMGMVKAFAYGSGSEEVANLLQYHRADYLGVAFTDEGVVLRKNNITLPIMVMNPTEESFTHLLDFQLEPEIYSPGIFRALVAFLQDRPCTIHLEMDTGMHRLGFEEGDFSELAAIFSLHKNIKVASVFTHLSGADQKQHDAFSDLQAERFVQMADRLDKILGYQPLRHVLNSPGILRLSKYQFDMVRLGIGLYGIDPTEYGNNNLEPVVTLKTIISQIKKIKAGDTIGYGRKGIAQKDMTTATLAIGYADGFSRSFSNGRGNVLINGQLAPVKGNVCMDMTMVDITGIHAAEGDEAIIFGSGLPIQQVAQWIETIPYELLTSTSERVKRVFYAEGI